MLKEIFVTLFNQEQLRVTLEQLLQTWQLMLELLMLRLKLMMHLTYLQVPTMKLMVKRSMLLLISGNDLIVERGKDGTTIGSHLERRSCQVYYII